MPFMPTKDAKRRYRTRAIPAILLMIGLHYGVHWAFDRMHPTGAVAVLLALLPSLSVVLLGVLIVQFLNADRDEVQIAFRRHAVACATGGTLAVCLVWNGLEVFHLAPEPPLGMVLPIFCVLLIGSALGLKRQYQ